MKTKNAWPKLSHAYQCWKLDMIKTVMEDMSFLSKLNHLYGKRCVYYVAHSATTILEECAHHQNNILDMKS